VHLRQPHAGDDPLEIDLRRAIELIDLKKVANATRDLGEYKGEMIVVGRGRFGPFVRHGKTYANIPKAEDPTAVTLERGHRTHQAKLAGARQHPQGIRGNQHPGARGPLRSVHHRRQQERQPAQGQGARGHHLEEATALLGARTGQERREENAARCARGSGESPAKKAAPKKKAAKKKAAKKKPGLANTLAVRIGRRGGLRAAVGGGHRRSSHGCRTGMGAAPTTTWTSASTSSPRSASAVTGPNGCANPRGTAPSSTPPRQGLPHLEGMQVALFGVLDDPGHARRAAA
jgi:hypothetical protein